MISQFYLKTPITELHVLLDRCVHELAKEEFGGFKCDRLLHVPVSQVLSQDAQARLRLEERTAPGIKFGKVALLVTDRDDYRPLGALVISEPDGRNDVSRSAAEALKECNIPTYLVTADNYREQVRLLLPWCVNKPDLGAQSAIVADRYELRAKREMLANVPAEFRNYFREFWRPMLQVGMMGVIEAVHISDDYQPSRSERDITTPAQFDALSQTPNGRQIRNHILNDFRRRSSFDLIFLGRESHLGEHGSASEPLWWPQLALEIDGFHHTQQKKIMSDHKKDLLCLLAGLPLVRLNLLMMESVANQDVQPGIWSIDQIRKAHWDYFRFVVAKSLRSFREFKKHQIETDREIRFWTRVDELKKTGLNPDLAVSRAVDEDRHDHEKEDEEARVEQYVEDGQREEERNADVQRYRERFGVQPSAQVHIDGNDVLHGRLGNFRLPPLKSFCKIAAYDDMTDLRIEFAEDWLLRQAIA